MQKSLSSIIAGLVAVGAFIYAAPTPASAATAPTVHYGQTDAGMVQDIGRRYNKGGRYARPYAQRPYGYGYSARPYRHGYYGRPNHGYYGRPNSGGYGYRHRRPGISLGFRL